MRKPLRRIVLAALPIGLLLAAPTIANNRSTTRVGPEKAVLGVTAEERAAREAGLHAWLTEERPRGALDAPIRVELSRQEQLDLAAPAPRRAGAEPLRIGIVKSIAPAIEFTGQRHGLGGRVDGGILQATSDGGFLWTAAITSPGATGIRLQLRNVSLPADADLYFYSLGGDVRGPYQGSGPDRSGEFWTNTVFSDTGVIALRFFGPHTIEDLRSVSFAITDLGYIGRGFPIPVEQVEWSANQCGNAACVVDASCGGLGPAAPAADAVAKMEWIQGAFIYTCTGGLIADTDGSTQRNLFLTANHCLSKSNANLETFFSYTTDSCEGTCPGNPSPDTTGVTVLATGRSGDFTLLELNQNPPAGATFLGWNSNPIAFTNGADLYRVSNPNFGPQVFSHHQVDAGAGTCSGWPRGERIYSNDLEGATDGGSSGSPVVNSASEVVGQLSGCCGFNCGDVCDTGANSTVDGALAHYFNSVASILDPPGGGGCSSNAECDDGQFCNGAETCSGGSCQAGADPCPGQSCDEGANQCVGCTLLPLGASCTANAECCSNKCKGPPSNKTCR